jgi:hypothetical protein
MANEADAKKVIQEQRAARAKAIEEGAPKGKPTPTQDENDLAALGVPVERHEDDGSGPDEPLMLTRQAQPERTGQPQPRPATTPRPHNPQS